MISVSCTSIGSTVVLCGRSEDCQARVHSFQLRSFGHPVVPKTCDFFVTLSMTQCVAWRLRRHPVFWSDALSGSIVFLEGDL